MPQNCLVGTGLRKHIKIGASGKVARGVDIVTRICQGADFTLSARAMMFAVGCIQAMKCHTNRCPAGVATQDQGLSRRCTCPTRSNGWRTSRRRRWPAPPGMVASDGPGRFHDIAGDAQSASIHQKPDRCRHPRVACHRPGSCSVPAGGAWRAGLIDASAEEVMPEPAAPARPTKPFPAPPFPAPHRAHRSRRRRRGTGIRSRS